MERANDDLRQRVERGENVFVEMSEMDDVENVDDGGGGGSTAAALATRTCEEAGKEASAEDSGDDPENGCDDISQRKKMAIEMTLGLFQRNDSSSDDNDDDDESDDEEEDNDGEEVNRSNLITEMG